MSASPDSKPPKPTVFLSYASEDRKAAQAVRDAIQTNGLEVWYDESALDGGDAWDQKIRRQIRECDFFMPLISAQTEVRPEGYFRREWRLAVERTLDMADDHTFLLPVVIDGTAEAGARVPDRFLTVQWMKLPGGQPTPALEALCRRLLSGQAQASIPRRPSAEQPARSMPGAQKPAYPELPREEPGQRLRFLAHVIGWAFHSAWVFFSRLPRWVRILAIVWFCIAVVSRGCSDDRPARAARPAPKAVAGKVAAGEDDDASQAAVAQLGAQIARNATEQASVKLGPHRALLAIAFSAPAGDQVAKKLADSTFTQMYGRLALSQQGSLDLVSEPLAGLDPSTAAVQGREHHASHVLIGAIDGHSPPRLVVDIVAATDGAVLWSQEYPASGADPARIATDVNAKLQGLAGH